MQWHYLNKMFWEELITYFSLIRYGPRRKGHIHQFFCCSACIHCHVNVFTELLLSDDRGIHIQIQTDVRDL
jgi:hypothetical protein